MSYWTSLKDDLTVEILMVIIQDYVEGLISLKFIKYCTVSLDFLKKNLFIDGYIFMKNHSIIVCNSYDNELTFCSDIVIMGFSNHIAKDNVL